MRKLSMIALAALMSAACACLAADVNSAPLQATMGAASNGTFTTVGGYNGYIDSVYVSVSGGTTTGNVVVAMIPADAGMAAINVATNIIVGTKVFRPRVDVTDIAGTALTSDGLERFLLVGEKLRLTVTASEPDLIWTATVNLEK